MKAKFGAIVVAGSGKINGFVASRNRAGAYFRTKVTPVNPQSSFQTVVRARLGSLSQAWRDLTENQRASWNAAVANFAKTDIFGDLKNPSGFNLFQRLNNNLAIFGEPQIDVAPLPSGVLSETLAVVTADASDGEISVQLTGNVPAGTFLDISATPALSPGKNFAKSEFRSIAQYPAATVTPIDIGPTWITRFGALVAGQKIFVKVKFVNGVTGEASPEQIASTIVVA